MPEEVIATEEYHDSVCVDSWRCSNCGGSTYDDSGFEIPTFCCRCGSRFNKHVYMKDSKDAVHK